MSPHTVYKLPQHEAHEEDYDQFPKPDALLYVLKFSGIIFLVANLVLFFTGVVLTSGMIATTKQNVLIGTFMVVGAPFGALFSYLIFWGLSSCYQLLISIEINTRHGFRSWTKSLKLFLNK
ncbi:MAG: hypothetical protein ISR65_08430 [Bacteriovoracaceae bacterium]|nr:hypothetical protein [Bacteriovoracaceae bacterium]